MINEELIVRLPGRQTEPINVVTIEGAYFCANCSGLVNGDELIKSKRGRCCPLCESAQVYPVEGWFNRGKP